VEQAALYREFLSGRHQYPVAPPGRSQHNYGLAIDLTCDNSDWLGAVWNHWGGLWSKHDAVHFGVR
jgi:LAS superfamily LD-carboxypeptidase LdcB